MTGGQMRSTPALASSIQVIDDQRGTIWAFLKNRNLRIDGADPTLLQETLELLHQGTDVASVRNALAGRFDNHALERVLAIFATLIRRPAQHEAMPSADPGRDLMLLGNGGIFRALTCRLRKSEIARCRFVAVDSFASCLDAAFIAAEHARVLWRAPTASLPSPIEPGDEEVEHYAAARIEDLARLCGNAGLVICALEGVPIRALLDVEEACTRNDIPHVHIVLLGPEEALIGPTSVPTVGAAISEWLRPRIAPHCDVASVFPLIRTPQFPLSGSAELLAAICLEVDSEARAVLSPTPRIPRAGTIVHLEGGRRRFAEPIFPSRRQSWIGTARPDAQGAKAAALSELSSTIGRSWIAPIERPRPRAPNAYRTVGIVGGGTAGYLTALALRARRPELDVTLIESSKIPVIGVGEATTPDLVRFLHSRRLLGLDVADFWERVRPTLKLGIKFWWGLPGKYFFTFPFQRGRLLESYSHTGTLNHQSLGSLLMCSDRAPVFARADGTYESHLDRIRWAYHLDNRRFVNYLREEALRAGVEHRDCIIRDAVVSSDGQQIEGLLSQDGQRLEYDLYVDCSGFRSMLLEQKLGSTFHSYQSTLMTDCAIAAAVPHDGVVKPYTLAETMDHGWCWNIPFEDEDHRGYVFSTAFASVDQAMDEMRRKNPAMHDPFVVRFRSGRHQQFWKGNVIAVGNSYAFVEPLESTAIHMIVLQLDLLTAHFPESREDKGIKNRLNERVNQRWDSLRWFLGLHYKFNRKLATPFWQAAREGTNISGAEERLELFRERAPLSYQRPLFYPVVPPEFFSDDHSFDTILVGQQVAARLLDPEDREGWLAQMEALERFTDRALGQREALKLLRTRSDMLAAFIDNDESWVHPWLAT
jgi:tryptophan halogenase